MSWEDFERSEETIQLGLNSYMVVPVTCAGKLGDKRRFFAWVSDYVGIVPFLKGDRTGFEDLVSLKVH